MTLGVRHTCGLETEHSVVCGSVIRVVGCQKSLHRSTSMLTRPTLLFGGMSHHPDCMLLEHALAHICYRSIALRRSSHFWWGSFNALGRDMNCRWLGKLSTSKLNLTVQTNAALALFGSVRVLVVLAAASLLDLHFPDVPHATRTFHHGIIVSGVAPAAEGELYLCAIPLARGRN